MRRRRDLFRGIGSALLVGAALVALAACSQAPQRATVVSAGKSTPGHGIAAPAHVVDGLALVQDELSWAGIRIGLARAEVERLLGAPLPPLESNEICANFVATRTLGNVDVTFEFADESSQAPLEHLFIPLAGDLPQAEQVQRLKRHLPGSTYVPSRYAPELGEGENPKPVFRVATPQPRVVMLRSNEGLWLGDPRCYD